MVPTVSLRDQLPPGVKISNPRITQRERYVYVIHLLNAISRGCLGTVICAAPWCLGAVEPSVQLILYAAILASLFIWCISAIVTQSTLGLAPVRLPLLILPVLGGLLLLSYQVRVAPRATTKQISLNAPATTVANEVAAADSAAWSDSTQPRGPFNGEPTSSPTTSATALAELLPNDYSLHSIAVGLTRVESAKYGMTIVVLFLGVVLFQSQSSQFWLWGALAVNGAALSLFGVVHKLSSNGQLFWSVPLTFGGQPFASYVNHNNAAGYLTLTLSAALGVLTCALIRKDWFDHCHKILVEGHGSHSRRRFRRVMGNAGLILAKLDRLQLIAMLLVILILTGIASSGSRSGLMATGVAGVTCLFLLVRLRGELRSRTAIALELSLFMIGLVLWTGLVGNATNCWGKGSRQVDIQANWNDALKVVADFRATGTGLGTYRYAYLPYQSRLATYWFTHADNQFVELLVEGGLVAIGLTVVVILASLGSTLALARNRQRPLDDPASVVGTFAVISQTICACFDYGVTLPANLLTLALVVGAVAGRGARLADSDDSKTWWLTCPGLRPAWMILLIGVTFLVHGVIGWREVAAAAVTRNASRGIPRNLDAHDALTPTQLNQAISKLTAATLRQPDNGEAHRTLAELYVYQYRLAVFAEHSRLSQSQDSALDWRQTDLTALYVLVNELHTAGQQRELDDLRHATPIADHLRPARQHYLEAQRVSPLLPGVDLPLATLAFLDAAGSTNGARHLQRAIALAPKDPEVIDAVATLAEISGLKDLAYGCWRRELILNPLNLQRIATHLGRRVDIQEQMARVLPDAPEPLIELATTLYAGPDDARIRHELLTKAVQLSDLRDSNQANGSGLHLMGQARWLLGEHESAIDHYRRALILDPLQLTWRLELVDLLRSQGQISLAIKQAEICLSIASEKTQIRELLDQLRANSPSISEPVDNQ